MKLPWTCERCGTSNYHYGMCVATDECSEIAATKRSMRKLLDLAREINPAMPPDSELEGHVVRIRMSRDGIAADIEPS